MRTRNYIGVGAASLLALWLLVPSTDIVSPDWDVRVTDTGNNPIAGVDVQLDSQQYTIESQETEENKHTDSDGYVHFDARRTHASGFRRISGVLRNLAATGAHASFGVHTWVHAFKGGYGDPTTRTFSEQNSKATNANGEAKKSSHIMLLHCQPGYSGIGCDFPDDPSKPILPFQR